MKYYAIFKESSGVVEVSFPDLEGCVTFGNTWEEALDNASDALAGWLAHAEPQFVKKPSDLDALKHLSGRIMPVSVDEKIKQHYESLHNKRFNVIFPEHILDRVDAFRRSVGLKRSTVLRQAVEEYLNEHSLAA